MSEVRHIVIPGHEVGSHPFVEGSTVANFLMASGWNFQLPTICVHNGKPLMRCDWDKVALKESDDIFFLSKPHGGGRAGRSKGVQIAGLIGMIALAAIAPWAAGTLLALESGTFAYYAAVAAITFGGSLLLSTFLKPFTSNNDEKVNQLYSLTAAGNTAKPFQSISCQYGRLKTVPAYASIPYSEYEGDDQYLCVLLCQGIGKYDVEQILVDDTVLYDKNQPGTPPEPSTGQTFNANTGNVTDTQFAVYDPGVPVTLFPTNVTTASEVNGIQLEDATDNVSWGPWAGGFVVNTAGTTLQAVAWDIIFPGGLYGQNDSGDTFTKSCQIEIQVRPINDAGTPLGDWTTPSGGLKTYTLNTRQPKRFSIKLDAISPRYETRMRRHGKAIDDGKGADTVIWGAVRAFLEGPNTYDNVSIIAIRMKATAQLSQQSSKQFGLIQTRVLPVWNSDDEEFVEQPTQNAFWAFWDMATNPLYGASRPVSKMDFATILAHAEASDAREEHFNYEFSSSVTFPEAFDTALGAVRSNHIWVGDILSVVRDELKPIPSMALTDMQIVRGTLSIDYILNNEDESDCVIGEFLNEATWKPAEVQYPPNGVSFTGLKPTRMQIRGITNEDQLYKEIAFFYLQSQYRRIKVHFDTEHDGRVLKFGSVIALQSFLPRKWGQSFELVSYNSGSKVLTVDASIDWSATGQFYMECRDKRGRYFGPVKCSEVSGEPTKIQLNAVDLALVEAQLGFTINDAFDRMDGAEPPSVVIGIEAEISRRVLVLEGSPRGDKVTLLGVVDDPRVHTDDLPTNPVIPLNPGPTDPVAPVIVYLQGNFRQGNAEPIIDVSWWPSAGAWYYHADVSYDEGASWAPIYEGTEPKFTAVVDWASLRVRVSGHNARHGAWSSIDLEAPDITIPPIVTPGSLIEGLRDYVTNQFSNVTEQISDIQKFISSYAAEVDSENVLRQVSDRLQMQSLDGRLQASVETVSEVAITNTAAIASLTTSVNASINGLIASVTTNSTAIATLNGQLAAKWGVAIDINGYITGIQLISDGSTSAFTVAADVFRVAWPGNPSGTPVVVFQVANVNGVAKLAFRGDMYADGTITGTKIVVDTIETNHLVNHAATQQAYATHNANATWANNAVLTSVTVDTKSDKISITWTSSIKYNTAVSSLGAQTSLSYTIRVDNTDIKTFTFWSTPGTGTSNPYPSAINQTFTLEATIENLTPGSHTFKIVNTTGSPSPTEAGWMRVQDMYK